MVTSLLCEGQNREFLNAISHRKVTEQELTTLSPKKIVSYQAKINEPWIFGIEYESVEEFLIERGFCNVKNVTSEFLKSIYFKGKNEKRKVYPFFGHVNATVNIH